jgi:hypothetical protein
MYQDVLWAAFHSSGSFDRVPMTGETLNIRAPDIDPTKEGGVGFYELQNLLKASDRVDEESEVPGPDIMERVLASGDPKSQSGPRMLDVRVERARTYINPKYDPCCDIDIKIFIVKDSFFYPTIQGPEYTSAKKAALAHALLNWGGFATLQPMFGSKSPYNSDQEDVPVDSERMRQVLNEAAHFTNRPDPSFAKPTPKPTVPEITRVEEVEVFSSRPAPVRKHSRSWSLPSPPPDSPESPSKPTKTGQSSDTKGVKAAASPGATVRQQRILAKAKKAAQSATKKQKNQVAGGTESQDKGDAQKQEWTMSKKDAANRLKKSAKPDAGLKDRIWDVVGKWF